MQNLKTLSADWLRLNNLFLLVLRSARPDFVWKSGQVGAMTNHAKEHSSKNKHAGIKLGEKKIKVKFLTPVSEKGKNRDFSSSLNFQKSNTKHTFSINST